MRVLSRSGRAILQQIGKHFVWIQHITFSITKTVDEVCDRCGKNTHITDFMSVCGDLQGNSPDKAMRVSCHTIR